PTTGRATIIPHAARSGSPARGNPRRTGASLSPAAFHAYNSVPMRSAFRRACVFTLVAAGLQLLGAAGCRAPQRQRPAAERTSAASAGAAVRLESRDGTWWLTAPSGGSFFSLAVSSVTPGFGPDDYDSENPGYAAFRHYPDTAAWAKAAVSRLREWGFT